ncbi:MAG: sigma-70 family RNA polymerase sigma factor [Gammaproteobacteria bacterium]|nr:sigma-70 family RNA polymerase sigma factor [Gammaproteobacteria bacterium]
MFANDKKRFTQWVRQYQPFLFRAAWALSGEREIAKDLVQETFALAWRARKQLRDEAATQAWLYRILRREAMRIWREREPWEAWDDAQCAGIAANTQDDTQTDLLNALQALNPLHRDVLVPFYLADMSYEQLAAMLDIPIGTVMSRLSRARRALRQLLEEEKTS